MDLPELFLGAIGRAEDPIGAVICRLYLLVTWKSASRPFILTFCKEVRILQGDDPKQGNNESSGEQTGYGERGGGGGGDPE